MRGRYDEKAVLTVLSRLFPEQLSAAPRPAKDKLAAALAAGNTSGVVTMSFGRPTSKTTSSYGDAGRR